MGKASSAKKVARVARAGGRVSGVRQRNLMFPLAIAGIFLAGVGLVGFAWQDHRDNASSEPPVANQDHWHSAFGVYVCGEFLPDLPENESPVGIHTHADGVIHIHPRSDAGSGDNATLGKFIEDTNIELSGDELRVGEDTWKEGDDKCGDQDGELVVARWQDVQTTDNKPTIIDEDFNDLRFREDGEGYVIAFVPEDEFENIPKPPSAGNLTALGAADDPNAFDDTTTTVPGEATIPGSTLPIDPNAATTLPPDPNATAPETTVP